MDLTREIQHQGDPVHSYESCSVVQLGQKSLTYRAVNYQKLHVAARQLVRILTLKYACTHC